MPRQIAKLRKLRSSRASASRTGAVMIEVALTFPILMMIVFGMVEYINVEFIRQGLAEAAYEGSRSGIVRGATAEEVNQTVLRKLRLLGMRQATVTTEMTDQDLRVHVSVPLQGNTFGVSNFIKLPSIEAAYHLEREKDAPGTTSRSQMANTLLLVNGTVTNS